jgi:hypothetical protein
MVAEDLLFWLAPLDKWVDLQTGVLCRRHADAMVVPRGWILDDRREPVPRLFRPSDDDTGSMRRPRRRRTAAAADVEQLELSESAPLGADVAATGRDPEGETVPDPGEPIDERRDDRGDENAWRPDFDDADDLDGLLEVQSPLLARAFRGTDRPKR